MTWSSSNRHDSLPSNWTSITRQVLAEQPRCQLAYPDEWATQYGVARCAVVSTEVDHIDSPIDHSRANLRGVCTPCHKRRTQQQAQAGARATSGRSSYPSRVPPGLR